MKALVEKIRQYKPVVHCITNPVTTNDCANVLVAVGASPIMAHHIKEVAEITSKAGALVINLGATDDYAAIWASVTAANEEGIPVVMDPVGCGTSTYRRSFALELLKNRRIDCLRGNYSEIVALLQDRRTVNGLDNKISVKDLPMAAIAEYARNRRMLIFASGKMDYIFDGMGSKDVDQTLIDVCLGEGIYGLQKGDTMLTTITGSGCMLSALTGAALAVDHSAGGLIRLCHLYGSCARKAAEKARAQAGGSMTFKMHLIDGISLM